MNSFLNQLTELGVKRFFKLLLKRTIGQYLDGDLALEQFSIDSAEGLIKVENLELSSTIINDSLTAIKLPLKFISGNIDSIYTAYSFSNIFSEGFQVQINCLRVKLCLHSDNSAVKETKAFDFQRYEENFEDVSEQASSNEGQLGLQFLANWIEEIISKLKVSCKSILFEVYENCMADSRQLFCLHLQDMSFLNNGNNDTDNHSQVGGQKSKTIRISNIIFTVYFKNLSSQLMKLSDFRIQFDLEITEYILELFCASILMNVELSVLFELKEFIGKLRGIVPKDDQEWLSSDTQYFYASQNNSADEFLSESAFFDAIDGPQKCLIKPEDMSLKHHIRGTANVDMFCVCFIQDLEVLKTQFGNLKVSYDQLESDGNTTSRIEGSFCDFELTRNINDNSAPSRTILQFLKTTEYPLLELHAVHESPRIGQPCTNIVGKCNPITVSCSSHFIETWSNFFSQFDFDQQDVSTSSMVKISFHIPAVDAYVEADDYGNSLQWKQVFGVACPWIFGKEGASLWSKYPKCKAIQSALGGLYFRLESISITLQQFSESYQHSLVLKHGEFGFFLSSSLSSCGSLVDDDCYYSTKIAILSSNTDLINIDIKASPESSNRVLTAYANKVEMDVNKHQFDIFMAVVKLLNKRKSSTLTKIEQSQSQANFCVVIHSEFSLISLGDDSSCLIENFLHFICVDQSREFESLSSYLRDHVGESDETSGETFKLCIAVRKPYFDLQFSNRGVAVGIKANDLKVFEMDFDQFQSLRQQDYDFYSSEANLRNQGSPTSIINRTNNSLISDRYAFDVHVVIDNPIDNSVQSKSTQSVQVNIDLEDICVDYDPSSIWFLKFVSLLTINSPDQIIRSIIFALKSRIESIDGKLTDDDTMMLQILSQVLNNHSFHSEIVVNNVNNSISKLKCDVELTKVSVQIKNSLIRYFCAPSHLLLCGSFNTISMSTSILSSSPSLTLKFSFGGLQLSISDTVGCNNIEKQFVFDKDKFVDFDVFEITVSIRDDNQTTADVCFGSCNIDCDISRIQSLLDIIKCVTVDVEEARTKSESLLKKNKAFDDDGILFSYQDQSDTTFDKVRICGDDPWADEDRVIVPSTLMESFLQEKLIDINVFDELPRSLNGKMIEDYFNRENHSWTPDYDANMNIVDEDSVLGSLLNSNHRGGASEYQQKFVELGSCSSHDSRDEVSHVNSHIASNNFEDKSVIELKSIKDFHNNSIMFETLEEIAGSNLRPEIEHSLENCPILECDDVEDIWDKDFYENHIDDLVEELETESRWYVGADELEILHDYIPIYLGDLDNDLQFSGCSKSLQITIKGSCNIKIFSKVFDDDELSGHKENSGSDDFEGKVVTSAADSANSIKVNHRYSSIHLRIRNATFGYAILSSNEVADSSDSFPREVISCKLQDFLIMYENSLCGPPYKVLGSWLNSTKRRDSSKPMLRIKLFGYLQNLNSDLEDKEYRMELELLPLRCYLDYNLISCVRWLVETSHSISRDNNPNESSGRKMFFQSCSTNSVDIKIDYRATYLNLAALSKGDFCELLNIFPIDGLELTLKSVCVNGMSGIESLAAKFAEAWIKDIYSNQFYRIISGITPFRGISQIGSNLQNIVSIPITEYRKDKNLSRHITKSTKGLFAVIARESLDVSHKVTKFVANTITDLAADSDEQNFKHNVKGNNISKENSSFTRGQPKSLKEGLNQAYNSMNRECSDVLESIVAIPVRQYESTGRNGLVTIVAKLLPVAILKPIGGLVEGISFTLLGLRNNIDPDSQLNDEDVWKVDFDS